MEARRRASADPQVGRRRPGLLPPAQRSHAGRAGVGGRRAAAGRARADPGGRSDRAPRRRDAASVPDDHDTVRPPARRRPRAGDGAAHPLRLRPAVPRRGVPHGRAAGPARRRARGGRPSVAARAAAGDRLAGRRAGLSRRCAGPGTRRRDGQGAGLALRGGPPRPPVAQGQVGPDPRSRRARRGVGTRPPPRVAEQPPPGRARPRAERVRDARARRSRE